MGLRHVAGIAGASAPPITLAAKDGTYYVRGIDAWHSGIAGCVIHRIPEFPDFFTLSHADSGLRVGPGGRFKTVQDAVQCATECFGKQVDFTQTIFQLRRDAVFLACLEFFCRVCFQAKKDMSDVKQIDIIGRIMEEGFDKTFKRLNEDIRKNRR